VLIPTNKRSDLNIFICGALFCILTLSAARCQDAAKNVPNIRDAAEALSIGDLSRAEADLTTILQKTPDDAHALNLLGIVRAQQKREVEAETLFKQAITYQPTYAGAHASLGLLYLQMGKQDLAIPQLQAALRLDPGRKDAEALLISIWREQAHAAVGQNDFEKALAILLNARKIDPENADAEYDLGMVALRMSLFPDAIDAFNEVLKRKPDDAPALYGLGRAEMSAAEYPDAQRAIEHYVRLRPDDSSGHYALGLTLQALQNNSDARKEFQRSITLQPQQTESYLQLGLMDLDGQNFDAAEQEFDRVLKRAPEHAGALVGKGRVKFQEKEYAEASELLEKASSLNPESREAHYYLGLADARLGKKEDSDKELQIASRIEHEEVERHQNMLKILDPDQVQVSNPQQKQ
jgi:tetratricopeptide (TPR) repeat protein